MSESNTDILELFSLLAAAIFDTAVANIVGPYLLIVFAALTGAAWSLMKRESKGKWSAFFYYIRIVFTAILLTTLIANIVASYFPNLEVELLIAPVALAIGVVGDNWLKVFTWFLEVAKKFTTKKVNEKLED